MFCYLDKPGPPESIEVFEIQESAMNVQWKPPKSNGGADITNYILEFKRKGDRTWRRIGKEDNLLDLKYSFTEMQSDEEYEFRVAAVNKAGVGDFSEASKPVKFLEPINFATPLEDQTVEKFPATATFECIITKSNLKPKWLKNGKEISKSNKKYDMISKNGTHQLVIGDVEGKDEGEYTIDFESVRSTANLFVKGSFK